MLFETVLELWLEEKRSYIKSSTYAYYQFEIHNYILPIMGRMPADEIDETCIQNAVLTWQKEGMENGRPLKKSTVQNLLMLLKQVLKYASRKEFVESKPLEVHFAMQENEKNKKVFDPEEQSRIIDAVLKDLNYKTFGILLCLNSGLRIGELCALKWEDIDVNRRILHVSKTLQRIYSPDQQGKTEIIITSPKTLTSIRDIPVSSRIIDVIQLLGKTPKNCYVLTNQEYFTEPRAYRKFYNEFLHRIGISELHFHCLRHTFATRCVEKGADYKSVSEILGHATIHTTLNMYVHPLLEEKRKCVELINWE